MILKQLFLLALFLCLFGTSGWSYDSVGRLQGESGPFGNDSLSYSYDSLNRVQSLSIGRDATSSDTESFGYDTLGRLSSVSASAGAFGNVGTFGYSYVGNTSLLSQMTRPNGTKTVLSYENAGTANASHRLTGVQDVNATGDNIASFGYGYDGTTTANGFVDNRTSQTRSYGSEGAQTISYGYNPTSMLQGEGAAAGGASTPALSKNYVFDAMGNRTGATDAVAQTQTTSTYNALNQLTGQSSYSTATGAAVGTGSSAFGYDGDGNMNSVTAKDASGVVTGQTSYAYDDASRLIGITTPSGKWQFVYDGMSRLRISRSWNWVNGAWVQDSEKRRVYLGMDVVQERDQNNNVTASYSGGLSARSTAIGTVFYGFDGNGSVTSLTDATGAVVGSYTYDAWGNTLASSGAKAQENPYRYSGKEQLAGYYSFGYRFYNAGLGRWINRDPLEEDGGINLYAYVEGNPVNTVDPDGLQPAVVAPPVAPVPVAPVPVAPAPGGGIGGAIGGIIGGGIALPVLIIIGGTLLIQTPLGDDSMGPVIEWRRRHCIQNFAQKGRRNIENEFSREAKTKTDPCKWLEEQLAEAVDSVTRLKIIAAQKDLGCRNAQKRRNR